jgi:hypothetical protein
MRMLIVSDGQRKSSITEAKTTTVRQKRTRFVT